jgi:type I restriction enzyme S subunit
MKKYEAYKESGVDWIGQIPKGWKIKKMKWITSIKRGASPRPIADPKYFDDENGEFSWVRISDVSASERYLLETKEKLSKLGASLSVKRYPGDFFLSIAGSVGKPIITKIKCCIHDGFVWFPELKLNPEFLYYIFQSDLPFGGLGKVGTQLNLNTETIGNIQIPDISEDDINSIINYLDEKTTIIDGLIDKKEQLVKKLKEQRQAIINEAVTKGLNPDAKLKDSGIGWLGEIPEHWEVAKLKWFSNIFSGGTPSTNNESFWTNGTIPWLNSGTVNQKRITQASAYITDEALKNSSTKWVSKGSILMALAGQGKTKGMAAMLEFDATCNQSMAAIEIIETKAYNEFILIWLETNYLNIRSMGGGEKRDGINLQILGNIYCPLPSIKEQKEISKQVTILTSKIDMSSKELIKSIKKLKEYRQSIISEAVTGKIDVRDWQLPKS